MKQNGWRSADTHALSKKNKSKPAIFGWAGVIFLTLLIFRSQERSVNNSNEIVFVESLKLWGLQEYLYILLKTDFFVQEYQSRAYILGMDVYVGVAGYFIE